MKTPVSIALQIKLLKWLKHNPLNPSPKFSCYHQAAIISYRKSLVHKSSTTTPLFALKQNISTDVLETTA
jgi:hypothetical protein